MPYLLNYNTIIKSHIQTLDTSLYTDGDNTNVLRLLASFLKYPHLNCITRSPVNNIKNVNTLAVHVIDYNLRTMSGLFSILKFYVLKYEVM